MKAASLDDQQPEEYLLVNFRQLCKMCEYREEIGSVPQKSRDVLLISVLGHTLVISAPGQQTGEILRTFRGPKPMASMVLQAESAARGAFYRN
jgi:hypothetical protein